MEFYIIVIALLVAFVVFCISMAVKTSKIQKSAKKKFADKKKEIGFLEKAYLNCMTGLPIPEGAECMVYMCPDKYVFERNESTYNLPINKITDISIKTDVEIQNAYTSSIGGAVGGALLFGGLGAIIGGRTKKKTDKIVHSYLIFAYKKDDNIDFISFDCTNASSVYKFIEAFNKIPKENKTINL